MTKCEWCGEWVEQLVWVGVEDGNPMRACMDCMETLQDELEPVKGMSNAE